MARTSKTVIGGGAGEQSDRMMRAEASGQEARARAHSELMAEGRATQDRFARMGEAAGGLIEEGERRQQQDEQFDKQLAQRQSETELDAAKAGFEPRPTAAETTTAEAAGPKFKEAWAPPTEQEQKQSPASARGQKVQNEMAKGASQGQLGPLDPASQKRMQDQTRKPLEQDSGTGRWRSTDQRNQMMAREQEREDYKAFTDRMAVVQRQDAMGVQAQRALLEGKQKDYEALSQQLSQIPNDMTALHDRVVKGDATDSDWESMARLFKGSEQADPSLKAALEKKDSKRVRAALSAMIAKSSLETIVRSNGNTKHLDIDWMNPRMQEFEANRAKMSAMLKGNVPMQQMSYVTSSPMKMNLVNTLAAVETLNMPTSIGKGSQNVPATDPAAAGGEGEARRMGQRGAQPAAPPMQPQGRLTGQAGMAADAAGATRMAGGTSQEALEAGQRIDPTAEQEPPPRTYHEKQIARFRQGRTEPINKPTGWTKSMQDLERQLRKEGDNAKADKIRKLLEESR